MNENPLTLEEAKKCIYGPWAGRPKGNRYVEGRCAYEVFPEGSFIPRQCSKKNGHGPEGLYCAGHAKKVCS
jgi:hypothetical protein